MYIKGCKDEKYKASTALAKYNLEGEKPTKLFSSILKKRQNTANSML